MSAVELSSVRKTFGPTVALDGCTLSASVGEVHAIVGGNGSGKSTLAKVISGVLIPDSGQVSILGKIPTSPYEARKLGVATVFQEVLVADSCSVLDNLFLGVDRLFSFTMSKAEKVEKGATLMRELLGYDLDLMMPLESLPLSLKQWITIGRALLTDPKVLILDESSAALDFESTERLFRKIRMIKEAGAVVFIVTHRIAELVRIADKATVLRDGVDVGCLVKEEITESNILDLIAGRNREKYEASEEPYIDVRKKPILSLRSAQVWPDSTAVNFDLFPGEIVGITGLDGQGQSEFVRALAGIDPFVSGTAIYLGDDEPAPITDLPAAHKNRIVYVTGDRKKDGIFPNLSIFENLTMPIYKEYGAGGSISFINRSKLNPIFERETDKLAVKMGSREDLITSLSGGNQQKVLIARAFAEKPNVLVLNDPARGVDVGAKLDLYRNLKEFAATGKSVVFLSSEIEEFSFLCTRVCVFRNGTITDEFREPFDNNVILNSTFGRGRAYGSDSDIPAVNIESPAPEDKLTGDIPMLQRPQPRSLPTTSMRFELASKSFSNGDVLPDRYVESSRFSPHLIWTGVPEGTKSFAISVTDLDVPEAFNFPRLFAHWLVYDIPPDVTELVEGVSPDGQLPKNAKELRNDFVTFGIPGFDRGYGGPWPPDRSHRYMFTVYALKVSELNITVDDDFVSFSKAVLPVAIGNTSIVGTYGPAKQELPK
ncbi:MAG: YbhB/YbcL family Raf kinase inhibitor-like protein [Anaerolineae bacterium]|nr:YbhB/YbcL family Raf kinase inhibitor-like protein [Anaerolineae bacterium]